MSTSSSADTWRHSRFDLKSLFLILSAVGIVLAPFHWLGGIYLFSAACSIGLVALCVLAYRSEERITVVVIAALGCFVGFFLVMASVVFFLHSIVNGIACIALAILGLSRRTAALTLVTVMVAIYGLAILGGAAEMRRLLALKEQYPFESLQPRLNFERRRSEAESISAQTIQLSADIATKLDCQDRMLDVSYRDRAWALRELHENSFRHFARAAGFGMMRMPTVSNAIERQQLSELVFPAPIWISSPDNSGQELVDINLLVVTSFVSSDRMGYVRSRDAVAGFESHEFNSLNEQWNDTCKKGNKWQVVRLELVSLLRHDEPRVYVADKLPAMNALADIPHRPLNGFEKSSLPKLITQEDVVFIEKSDRIQMLGAVRAGTTCLECHDGPRGKLLGAFSYVIDRVPVEKKSQDRNRRRSTRVASK